MEKRAILALVLSLAVVALWQIVFPPPPPRPRPVVAESTSAAVPAAATSSPAASSVPGAPAASSAPGAALAAGGAPLLAEAEADTVGATREELVIANEEMRVTVDSRGAVVTGIELQRYTEKKEKKKQEERLVFVKRAEALRGRAPLALEILAPPGLPEPNTEIFAVERIAAVSPVEGQGVRLTLRRGGLRVVKELRLRGGYLIDVRVEVDGAARWRTLWGPGLRDLPPEADATILGEGTALWQAEGKVRRRLAAKIKEADEIEGGQLGFVGFEDNYFMSVLLPEQPAALELRPTEALPGVPPGKKNRSGNGELAIEPIGKVLSGKIYAGPKDYEMLRAQGLGLERAVDYGWFHLFAYYLLVGLKFLYGYTHNYGVAIVLLTVALRILLFPLTYKQMVSMQKMQVLSPKMNAIKEKYKKAKQDAQVRAKMNQEMMKLYQQEGVNPAAGCLPMLVQLPILFAFYNMLRFSIELRDAPFVFWIVDLATKDPYYVTPLLMGATMWVQQKLTPTSIDPVQRRMFMMLPFVFTFMFMGFASGLVLYWLTNNVLSILQQLLMNRLLPPAAAGTTITTTRVRES